MKLNVKLIIMKRVIVIYENKKHRRGSCLAQAAIHTLTEHGFSVESVSFGREKNFVRPSFSADKLFGYLRDQLGLFARLFKIVRKGDIVYINSTKAIAAALIARMNKAKLICHLDSDAKPVTVLDQFAKRLISPFIHHVIFNSMSLKKNLSLNVKQQTVIYNSISREGDKMPISAKVASRRPFCAVIPIYSYDMQIKKRISSLALQLPDVKFSLVNFTPIELSASGIAHQPANVEIVEGNYKTHPYQFASVFLDLSNPNENYVSGDVELLKAMEYGLPVIVSINGALQELIIHGKHGLAVPIDALQLIVGAIKHLSHDQLLYKKLSDSCRMQAKLFSKAYFESEFIKPFLGQRLNPYNKLIQLFGEAYLELDTSVFASPRII